MRRRPTPKKIHHLTFRQAVVRLQGHFPALKVKVRRVRRLPPDVAGDCALTNERAGLWRIRVHAGLSADMAIEVLLHEWAHAVDCVAGPLRKDDHGETWGLSYALVYRKFIEND